MVIYNAKIVLVINGKDVSSNRFSWSPWYFLCYCLVLGLCCLEIKIYKAILNCVFYVSIHVDPVDGYACQQPHLSLPIWFLCSQFSTFPWIDAGIIILLPFKAIPWITTISSGNEQYGCISFCTSTFIDGQPCNTYSDSMLRFSSSIVADPISSVMH